MDTQSKDILEQLLEKLDKMDSQQHKIDRVMERLDTLQNVIERQNKKQNRLDEKLVEMAVKLEQEKVVMAEQLQAAHQETMQPRRVTDGQEESTVFQHKTTQQQEVWCSQIADKLKSIDDRTADTARKYDQLTSWLHKTEDKLIELADNNKDVIKTFLVEIRSVKDLIKGQTNSELIWLNNQIDKKLSDIGSAVKEIYQKQREAQEEIVCSAGQMVRTSIQYDKQQGHTESLDDKQNLSTAICDKLMHTILDLKRKIEQLNSSVLDMPNEIKTSLDTMLTTNTLFTLSTTDWENTQRNVIAGASVVNKDQSPSVDTTVKSDVNKLLETDQSVRQKHTTVVVTESEKQIGKIINVAETVKTDLGHLIQTQENIQKLINSIADRMQGDTATVLREIDNTKASMKIGHSTINNNLEILTTDLKKYVCKTKREIFAVTEKEAQIVRDRIQGPLVSHGKYLFDFYVNDFKTLVSSGKSVDSMPWHINELHTCVIGSVDMSTDGAMKVWLFFGRHPREVGLQPRPGKTLKCRATICDTKEKKLPSLEIGDITGFLSEANITVNGDIGFQVGVTSCDMLMEIGYGDKEKYANGAILIRYEVTV